MTRFIEFPRLVVQGGNHEDGDAIVWWMKGFFGAEDLLV
jgi:hypothetical protein